MGVDVGGAQGAGDGHPMVAVTDEMLAPDSVDRDGGQLSASPCGEEHQRPPPSAPVRRAKAAVERGGFVRVDGSHDRLDRDRLHPAGVALGRRRPAGVHGQVHELATRLYA